MSGKTKRSKLPSNPLLEALRFVAVAQADVGSEVVTHCRISQGRIVATNGIITAGISIAEDLDACPHTLRLIMALAQCEEAYAITQLSVERLSVKAGEFQAIVPCILPDRIGTPEPDANVAPINDSLKSALAIVAYLLSDKAEYVLTASAYVTAGSLCATNRTTVIEAWHGHSLPGFLLPRAAIKILIKIKRPLVGFGYSGQTATFWFDDGSWIKSQLYQERPPDFSPYLNYEPSYEPIPSTLFAAIKAVHKFCTDGQIKTDGDVVRSLDQTEFGAQRQRLADATLANRNYSVDDLLALKDVATELDQMTSQSGTIFRGPNCRGMISHTMPLVANDPEALCNICKVPNKDCDCIPF